MRNNLKKLIALFLGVVLAVSPGGNCPGRRGGEDRGRHRADGGAPGRSPGFSQKRR